MTESSLIELARRGMLVTIELAMPILVVTLVVGVLISIFQAATQIQETTLTFVPKIVAMVIAFAVMGPWMLSVIVHFTSSLFNNVPVMIR
ncbi:MAG: flagellar biosynthesis protein FliQ [Capsulimonadaceae bacterium]|nr:flagellar biosynthesis protein FliQ [Capsulimonadaceae bacterium]